MIDLRSDTVTRPTPAMKEAMWSASVGDDVYGEDPTVNALEQKVANMFGMEKALFCASGTMTNQLAIRVHCEPGSDVICEKDSHIYLYEGGGVMVNAQASVRLLTGDKGRLNAGQIAETISPENDIHNTYTRLVSLENTMNKGGGSYYDFDEILKIQKVCNERRVALHLDGARLFNAIVETNTPLKDYGQAFDSISICLSKGLGCPVGSLLLGTEAFIHKALRFRKMMGGGWRQAGMLAAAGIYALDHHVERLKDDHRRALALAELFSRQPEVSYIYPVQTNIVILKLQDGLDAQAYVDSLAKRGVLAIDFGKNLVRLVTHLDFSDDQLNWLSDQL
ncbi:L-threonine aldolase [Dyadobacter jejuensis]|uniref:L-threonine aldolase n=2 Tax=Dyadobacter jejuensis TaxID=1082580 RepID=A0A316AAF7_9BACT|nr:L-threonine aldolase [Dyadobacter jejuensis]